MTMQVEPIREWHDVDREVFDQQIVPEGRPAVLRSLVKSWPAVERGTSSAVAIADYLKAFETGNPVNAIVGPPAINGRFFYTADCNGFNFEGKRVTVRSALDTLVSLLDEPTPPAIALQALMVSEVLPGFETSNPMPLLDPTIGPRIWLGNQVSVATHFDNNQNIACVVAGRRRVTVFPPEQVGNLYIGPLLNTPGGSPISMVDLREPDLSKYPRFEQALESAQQTELEPGDAIFIPIMWWHGVESLDRFNLLVNYWWNPAQPTIEKPFHSLLHAMLLVSRLPPELRENWQRLFNHFVFQTNGDPAAHLPDEMRDIQGTLSEDDRTQLKAWLAKQLWGQSKGTE